MLLVCRTAFLNVAPVRGQPTLERRVSLAPGKQRASVARWAFLIQKLNYPTDSPPSPVVCNVRTS